MPTCRHAIRCVRWDRDRAPARPQPSAPRAIVARATCLTVYCEKHSKKVACISRVDGKAATPGVRRTLRLGKDDSLCATVTEVQLAGPGRSRISVALASG